MKNLALHSSKITVKLSTFCLTNELCKHAYRVEIRYLIRRT